MISTNTMCFSNIYEDLKVTHILSYNLHIYEVYTFYLYIVLAYTYLVLYLR